MDLAVELLWPGCGEALCWLISDFGCSERSSAVKQMLQTLLTRHSQRAFKNLRLGGVECARDSSSLGYLRFARKSGRSAG